MLRIIMDFISASSPSKLPVIGVLVDASTYKHLLYLLMALPLGFAYSALFSILVVGIALTVIGIGVLILLAALFIYSRDRQIRALARQPTIRRRA
jgi:hypothetical protein